MSPKPTGSIDQGYLDETLDRIREGAIEGIRREIDRRARAGEPIVVQRNGNIETVWPVNGAFPNCADE